MRGWGGFDWHWGRAARRRVSRAMASRRVRELELTYKCVHRWPQAAGCQTVELLMSNGKKK
jgi:hypothetical protein